MDSDFVYYRHVTAPGIKVEEISGGDGLSPKVWLHLARQVWQENGRDGYRVLDHTESGAPLFEGEPIRISVTHTGRLLCVASLPPTPECDLTTFSPRAALGIDAESKDRAQVLKVRDRVLNDTELSIIPADDLAANVLAWTIKEALYKVALTPGLDFRTDILIHTLPTVTPDPMLAPKGADGRPVKTPIVYGTATVKVGEDRHDEPFELYSWESEGCIVTVAWSPRSAKFPKKQR